MSSEYTSALAAGGILILALLHHWRSALWVSLGALPFILLVLGYNWICFGSPFSLGYSHVSLDQFQGMKQGLFGITFPPKLSSARLLLLSEERGLFFWSPYFVLMFAGLRSFARWNRRLLLVCIGVCVLQVFFMSGYYMPNGGAAMGPRHLAPLIPFAGLMACFGFSRLPKVGIAAGLASILFVGLATLLNALPPESMTNPVTGFYIPIFKAGLFQWNWITQLGGSGYWALVPLFGVLLLVMIQGVYYVIEDRTLNP